jgi:hypothetical protein
MNTPPNTPTNDTERRRLAKATLAALLTEPNLVDAMIAAATLSLEP